MLKMRWSHDHLIFNMGIQYLRKTVFILKLGPGGLSCRPCQYIGNTLPDLVGSSCELHWPPLRTPRATRPPSRSPWEHGSTRRWLLDGTATRTTLAMPAYAGHHVIPASSRRSPLTRRPRLRSIPGTESTYFNSLTPGWCSFNLISIIFKLVSRINTWRILYGIALRWMPQDLTDD